MGEFTETFKKLRELYNKGVIGPFGMYGCIKCESIIYNIMLPCPNCGYSEKKEHEDTKEVNV